MEFTLDPTDYYGLLAEAHARGRRLAPVIRAELPALLGQHAPTGLRLLADAAEDRRLHERAARHLLPVVIADCERAIARGTETRLDWYEARYVDGVAEMDCREIAVPSPDAVRLDEIRKELVELLELLERVLDLRAAQDAVPGLRA